jgi:hypothetical protein
VSPEKPVIGENVSVSVNVKNIGNASGNYTCSLMINEAIYASQEVTLDAGKQTTIHFTVPADKVGSYNMKIDDLTSTFSVIPTPAKFTLSSFSVTPDVVEIGQKVTISIKVSNVGLSIGSYDIGLIVDGNIIDSKNVTLDGNVNQNVMFSYTPTKPGKTTVQIGEFTKDIVVEQEESIQNQVLPSTTPEQQEQAAQTTQTTLAKQATSSKKTPLILGIAGGGIVIALVGFIIWKRKSGKSGSG